MNVSKVVVHALNFNDRPGQPLGGIVRVHLADAALAGNGGGVREGDGHGVIAVAGQDNILRSRVVDLVALRGLQLGYGVGPRIQSGQGIGSVLPGHNLFGESTVFRAYHKPRPGESLIGVGAVYLFKETLI